MLTSLPNLLTMSRIAIIPVIFALFYVPHDWAAWTAWGLFTLAGITDFFDGYLARQMNEVSEIGKFLDPIADKLLVASLLLMLVAFDRVSPLGIVPAMIILMREVLISGLREFLGGQNVKLPVSRLAKYKTAVQMVALGVLIIGSAGPDWWRLPDIGEGLLWISAILTVVTGWVYLKTGVKYMTEPPPVS